MFVFCLISIKNDGNPFSEDISICRELQKFAREIFGTQSDELIHSFKASIQNRLLSWRLAAQVLRRGVPDGHQRDWLHGEPGRSAYGRMSI